MTYYSMEIERSGVDWSEDDVLEEASFTDCVIKGPAILFLRRACVVERNVFKLTDPNRVDLAAMTYSDEEPPRIEGVAVIDCTRCRVILCTLEDVWVWAPRTAPS